MMPRLRSRSRLSRGLLATYVPDAPEPSEHGRQRPQRREVAHRQLKQPKGRARKLPKYIFLSIIEERVRFMHDWTLICISMDWQKATVAIKLLNRASVLQEVVAHGVRRVFLPREEPWGTSASVLSCKNPEVLDNGSIRLSIVIQSGDEICIDADRFDMPQQ